MRYYAAFGHTEFILCLGYKGDVIKEYFLGYNEALFNDFVLEGYGARRAGRDPEPRRRLLEDHVRRHGHAGDDRRAAQGVEPYLGDDEVFLATYGDGLSDVRPAGSREHVRGVREDGHVRARAAALPRASRGGGRRRDRHGTSSRWTRSGVRINGGFFVMRREVLDWIEPGDEFVEETFEKLIPRGEVGVFVARRVLRADGHDQGSAVARGAPRVGSRALAHVSALDPADIARRLMRQLGLRRAGRRSGSVLAIGAHSDDIEIGCGGTDPLADARRGREARVHWLVLAARGKARIDEATGRAPRRFLAGVREPTVEILSLRDGYLPVRRRPRSRTSFEALKARIDPTSCSPTRATISIRTIASCAT